MLVTEDRNSTKLARPLAGAKRARRTARQAVDAGSLDSSGGTARCYLCARDADYAIVYKAGRIYCSVECAEAVAGLYLG